VIASAPVRPVLLQLHTRFPYSSITLVKLAFEDWVAAGIPELRALMEGQARGLQRRPAL
jgi:hypothetical protein